ncbi:hypothetical protein L2E82_19055 [Cichorium intybus]|uniref:Uncharacterized protein n=1 Tax=Cichorium intybus TaxID=13427 RepID=A0ACB9FCI1_CICIN|nr:hypothetical protein L2E82_19055 [Cichorium intybus]
MKRIVRRMEEALEIQERTDMAQGASPSTVLTRSLQYQDLESFRIPLRDIIYTPDDEHRIGDGGFEERPTMDTVIDQLEDAIYFQEHKV